MQSHMQHSITGSLSLFPNLHRLTLSGGLISPTKPFFPQLCNSEEYAELGFDVGADPEKSYGRIIRESEGGAVKGVKRIRAWGNIIGREEEW